MAKLHTILITLFVLASAAGAQDDRINRLEQDLKRLERELTELRQGSPGGADGQLHLGGYGEIHMNFGEGDLPDVFDFHRIVFFAGYNFADWIRLNSEIEIEHAFVTDGAGGELVIEQLHLDFMLSDPLNVRVGRILTPVGIVNKYHEPTEFNGVERPSFAKYIVPSTWSSDGVGFYGNLGSDALSYEVYAVAGLDGSEFDDNNGIRGGRIKERPGLSGLAATGRMDWYMDPFRLGTSFYAGSIDNANKDVNNGIDGDIRLLSVDAEYKIGDLDLRGAYAHTKIHGADEIGNGAAEQIVGWYAEAAYHVLPDAWKAGKLEDSDLIFFVRYDDYDTQYDMPDGVAANPVYDRYDWTYGITFKVTENLVVKADYQQKRDKSSKTENFLNVGVGWNF